MAYISLYRRYRSQNFEELVGQDHIRVTLQNALRSGRLAQAYLFSGPRGTGKTSTARVFAKALNCEKGPAPEPCNECRACRAITSNTCMDVLELDAASHTGVDDVREVIIGRVHFPPTEVRRKVYIIDEVHKLSNAAFNALLKTLEEPPPHVLFILATTDPHTVPPTIVSRCQRFDFHRIPHEVVVRHLRSICVAEKIEAEEGALHAIAEVSDGAMRDALVVLEQVASNASGPVTEGTVVSILGLTPQDALSRMVSHLLDHEAAGAIALLHRLQADGKDPVQLARDLLGYLRKLLLYNVCKDPRSVVIVSDAMHDTLRLQAGRLQAAQSYRMVRCMVDLIAEMKDPALVSILWEAAVVRLAHPQVDADLASLANRVWALEAGGPPAPSEGVGHQLPNIRAVGHLLPDSPNDPPPRPVAPPASSAPATPPASSGPSVLNDMWRRLLSLVQRKGSGPLFVCMEKARPVSWDSGVLTLSIPADKVFERGRIEKEKTAIEELATEVVGHPVTVSLQAPDETGGGDQRTAPGKVHEGFVKNTMEIFGGRIVD